MQARVCILLYVSSCLWYHKSLIFQFKSNNMVVCCQRGKMSIYLVIGIITWFQSELKYLLLGLGKERQERGTNNVLCKNKSCQNKPIFCILMLALYINIQLPYRLCPKENTIIQIWKDHSPREGGIKPWFEYFLSLLVTAEYPRIFQH